MPFRRSRPRATPSTRASRPSRSTVPTSSTPTTGRCGSSSRRCSTRPTPTTPCASSSSPAPAAPSAPAPTSSSGGDTFDRNAHASNPHLEALKVGDVYRDGGGTTTLRMYESLKPIIGAINGAAVGIGATMQLPMDIRIASTAARFGFVFARRGITPEAASSWYLPRLVGMQTALEWCLTGRVFGADEALARGLVRSLHAPDELLPGGARARPRDRRQRGAGLGRRWRARCCGGCRRRRIRCSRTASTAARSRRAGSRPMCAKASARSSRSGRRCSPTGSRRTCRRSSRGGTSRRSSEPARLRRRYHDESRRAGVEPARQDRPRPRRFIGCSIGASCCWAFPSRCSRRTCAGSRRPRSSASSAPTRAPMLRRRWRCFARPCASSATSKAAASRWSSASPTPATSGCRRWPPSW